MFRAEPAGEIAPYLEPEYWGGKMIGASTFRDLPELERVSPVQPSVGPEDVKISSLRDVVSQPEALTTSQIYTNGEAFSPEKHSKGQVVIYRKEVLLNDPEKAEKLEGAPDRINLPLGLVLSNLPVEPPNEEPGMRRIVEPPYIYYSGGRMGIIADVSGTNGPSKLIYISKTTKLATKSGRGQEFTWANIEEAPFTIGQTRRYTTKQGAELLVRVNALVVFDINKKPKRKRTEQEKPSANPIFSGLFLPNQPSAQF